MPSGRTGGGSSSKAAARVAPASGAFPGSGRSSVSSRAGQSGPGGAGPSSAAATGAGAPLLSAEAPTDELFDARRIEQELRSVGTRPSPPSQEARRRVARLQRCLPALPATERQVLARRYGLGGWSATSAELVAAELGLSEGGVMRVERQALLHLSHAVAAGPDCGMGRTLTLGFPPEPGALALIASSSVSGANAPSVAAQNSPASSIAPRASDLHRAIDAMPRSEAVVKAFSSPSVPRGTAYYVGLVLGVIALGGLVGILAYVLGAFRRVL